MMGVMLNAQNPVAKKQAQVVCGNARFTVLTDRLIRMEWSPSGEFEDHATLAIVNRNLPVPIYSVRRSGNAVTLKTQALSLSYSGDGAFSADNLKASFRLGGKTVTWTPGADASGNLMGTARTLDGCAGPEKINFSDPLEQGILSRDGWAVVDESRRHIFVKDDSDWGEWVAERPVKDGQDLYLFAYGHDYKAALADYAKVSGSISFPPSMSSVTGGAAIGPTPTMNFWPWATNSAPGNFPSTSWSLTWTGTKLGPAPSTAASGTTMAKAWDGPGTPGTRTLSAIRKDS